MGQCLNRVQEKDITDTVVESFNKAYEAYKVDDLYTSGQMFAEIANQVCGAGPSIFLE
jgi:hypothetical protein